jgi:hypothetical protein
MTSRLSLAARPEKAVCDQQGWQGLWRNSFENREIEHELGLNHLL